MEAYTKSVRLSCTFLKTICKKNKTKLLCIYLCKVGQWTTWSRADVGKPENVDKQSKQAKTNLQRIFLASANKF